MTNEELVEMVQEDLRNECYHMNFYLLSSVKVQGLHREELREFFMKEAQSEMQHVAEFSELIVYLGGSPHLMSHHFPTYDDDPVSLLKEAVRMEQQVANIYAGRLRQTHEMENATMAYIHVFYEDQIRDSQRTAWELEQMIKQPWSGLSLAVSV